MSTDGMEMDNFMHSFNTFTKLRRPYDDNDLRIESIRFSEDSEQLFAFSNQRTIECTIVIRPNKNV